MLKSLYIKNYALIEEITFNPHNKLNIITGETGAGKSIILSALKLLTGIKFDENKFFSKDIKCIVEAKFEVENTFLKDFFDKENLDILLPLKDISENEIVNLPLSTRTFNKRNGVQTKKEVQPPRNWQESIKNNEISNNSTYPGCGINEIIIRREFVFGGRSRNFINDTPASIKNLKFITDSLIDIHQQHDTLLLKDPNFQLKLIDVFAQNRNLLSSYIEIFKKFKNFKSLLAQQKQKAQILSDTIDYKKYLLNELQEIDLETIDLQTLEKDINIAQNAETLKTSLSEVYGILETGNSSILGNMDAMSKILSSIKDFSQDYTDIHSRVESCSIELKDIIYEVHRCENKIETNPTSYLENKSKLDTIYGLFKKHNVHNIEKLLEIKHNIQKEISSNTNIQDTIDYLESEAVKYEQITKDKAEKLSKSRYAVITNLKGNIKNHLKNLGLGKTNLEIRLEKIGFSDYGVDEVKILFSANEGHDLRELSKCASGGEMSRLMLCFRYLINDSKIVGNTTMIFDEIDTGISGEIAIKVADMMKKMSSSGQILIITHLPQVAAIGDAHFFVYKHKQKNMPSINEPIMDGLITQAASTKKNKKVKFTIPSSTFLKEISRQNIVHNGASPILKNDFQNDEFIIKTDIRLLSKTERINAIATMIGGDDFTKNAFLTAKQLIGARPVHAKGLCKNKLLI